MCSKPNFPCLFFFKKKELGDEYFSTNGNLIDSVNKGLLTTDDVVNALRPVLRNRFRLGQFDPINATIYTSYGIEHLASDANSKINFDAALQAMVLLRNDGAVLPLTPGIKVWVLTLDFFSSNNTIPCILFLNLFYSWQ